MQKKLAIALFAFLSVPAATPAHAFLLAGLSDAEQSYHEQVFSYAMDNTKSGEKYDWKTYSGAGTFLIGAPFISKSGSNCRQYTETFIVGGQPQAALKGVACKRNGKDGWCSLKPDNALTCALEKRDFLSGHRYVAPSPNPAAHAGNGGGNVSSDFDFSVGGVHAPNVSAPNIEMPRGNIGGNRGNGSANGVAYDVTDTLGKAGAQGTGMALSWWEALFR